MVTKTPKSVSLIFLFVLFNLSSLYAIGTPSKVKQSLFNYLEQKQFKEILLEVDIAELLNKRPSEEEQKGKVTFTSTDGAEVLLNTEVSLRGKYRRQYCDFPPLNLNFSKKQLAELGLKGKFDKYKLVTHCMDNSKSNQVLLREFAVYKMYNEVTPESFRVQLLKITYQDKTDKSYQIEQLAFLIEDTDELAKRLGGKAIEKYGLTPDEFSAISYNNTMVFNYMIGNLDWNTEGQKNLKFIKVSDQQPLILVPYDFDFSGIVAPAYINLNRNFNQQSLEERFCLGKFDDTTTMYKAITKFKELQNNFVNTYTTLPLLKKSHVRKMNKYLTSFYDIINEEESALADVFLAGKYAP